MTNSSKILKVNVEGMIVEEIDGLEDEDLDLDKVNPCDRSEFIIVKNMEQAIPLPARP